MQDGTFSKRGEVQVTEPPSQPPAAAPSATFEVKSDCAIVSDVLSRIGDKWSVLVVSVLGNGTMRFSELRREIGSVSQKMLSTTLRSLERDGFVARTVHPTVPPKVEYTLTALGHDLLVPVRALGEWAKRNAERVNDARQSYDQENR